MGISKRKAHISGVASLLPLAEHASVEDYRELRQALEPFRAMGVRLAIDDVGAGFASMRHILSLGPDLIKLDMSPTRGVNEDSGRAAMTAALVTFAERTGCKVIAEGIETADELETLRNLGVRLLVGPTRCAPGAPACPFPIA